MLKRLLVVVSLIGMTEGAFASAHVCVPITSDMLMRDNHPDKYGSWKMDVGSISVEGVVACAATSLGTRPTSLSLTSKGNKNCWCKMVSPVMSKVWVGVKSYSTEDLCQMNCSNACRDALSNDTSYSQYLISQMTLK